uniref:GAIN-B domain-containing protein n=1 Tax=Lates calcarifer TaxID=8187 RepID=A0A4W6DGH2_LATCA
PLDTAKTNQLSISSINELFLLENSCKDNKIGGFSFPETPIGWFAYSEELCPTGTSGAGKSRASTRCTIKTGSPSFEHPPQVFKCDQTLSDIKENLTSVADLETLASSTQILTSKPEELTADNVTTAAQIANTLLLSPQATESVRVAAVATVSQLLNASTPDTDTDENNTTLSLTQTLDQLSVNLSSSLNTTQSQVVQPNLVVQSAQVPAADTQGVQFTSLTGKSGSFVSDRIQLNTNTSTVVVENRFIADALIYIRFPPETVSRHQKPSNVSLGFVLYQNDRFFRSRLYRRRHATIRVLSASVKGQERSVVPQHVEMLFRPMLRNGTSLNDFSCVFWDYSVEDWSAAGCSKGNASDGVLRCFCNHTTNFAALWSFRENYEYSDALDVISIIGLSVSILGLVVTIVYHIRDNFGMKTRQSDINSKIAPLCIYVSLLAFIITFLSGVENRRDDAELKVVPQTNVIPDSDEHVDPDRGSCTGGGRSASLLPVGHLHVEQRVRDSAGVAGPDHAPQSSSELDSAQHRCGMGSPGCLHGGHAGSDLQGGQSSGLQTGGVLLACSSGQRQTVSLWETDVLVFPGPGWSDPGLQHRAVCSHLSDHVQDRPDSEEVTTENSLIQTIS